MTTPNNTPQFDLTGTPPPGNPETTTDAARPMQQLQENPPSPPPVNTAPNAKNSYEVKVEAGALNIRRNPNTEAKSLGILRRGAVERVFETKTIDSKKWGKIDLKEDKWIALEFTTKV